jgi:prepilin-type N-terminal cleavage/methylation domain-containing protein
MRRSGFTLVELMIVVTIVGVLAVVAGVAYRKYSDSGRAAEATAMLGELKSKELAFRMENSVFLSTTTVGENDVYPALGSCSEPCAKAVPQASWPQSWRDLGVSPQKRQLYCGYVVVAGAANTWGLAGNNGKAMFNNVAPTVPWFYVQAICDNDRTSTANTTYTTTMDQSTVVTRNEHK